MTHITALTQREHEVLKQVATGATTHTIARRLHISPATCRNHIQAAMVKLQAQTRLQAVMVGLREGLLTVPGGGQRHADRWITDLEEQAELRGYRQAMADIAS